MLFIERKSKMPKKGYKQTPEHRANAGARIKKYHQEHPDAAKEAHNTPLAKANSRDGAKKYHEKHPDAMKKRRNTPKAKANQSSNMKKYHQEHPDAAKERQNTPSAKANHSAGMKKAKNTPSALALIQRYGSPLIQLLRSKYYNLNDRCNNPNNGAYKNYGGRGIRNLFPSQLDFLNYIINELHITKLSQIEGLWIDRTDNDSHYMPGNIRFITHQQNMNNRHRRNTSQL